MENDFSMVFLVDIKMQKKGVFFVVVFCFLFLFCFLLCFVCLFFAFVFC